MSDKKDMKSLPIWCIVFPLMLVSVLISLCVSDSYGLVINDSKLKIERIMNLTFPIDMAFLEQDDILVATRHNGEIIRIVNGTKLPEPLQDFSVANAGERGLISLAVAKNGSQVFVFTYHTQSGGGEDGDDITKGIRPLGSLVYRFELIDDKLKNPLMLAFINTTSDKPGIDAHVEAHHVGGKNYARS